MLSILSRLKSSLAAMFIIVFLSLCLASAQYPSQTYVMPLKTGLQEQMNQMQMAPIQKATFMPSLDLTGIYTAKPNGIYYVRQLGNQIYWYGEEKSQSFPPFWSNVAIGNLNGNTINANWVDIPKGQTMNSGTVVLDASQQQGMTVLNVQQETGGFGTVQMIRFDNSGTGILPP
jgi:hypothetical protein